MKIKFLKYNHLKRSLLLVFSLSLSSIVLGQAIEPDNLLFQFLTLKDGLPHNKVNAVSMDKDGFMWFGTNDGVCRWDGIKMRNYYLGNAPGDQTHTPQISSIRTDSKGNLLIGTYSLFRYNYELDRIDRCDTSKGIETIGRVYAIEEGQEGIIWIGTERGLYSYDTENDIITAFSSPGNSNLSVISLLPENGKIWLGTRNQGLLLFDIQNKTFFKNAKFSLTTDLRDQVNCLYKDANNVVWAGTQDNGIFKFNQRDSSVRHIYPDIAEKVSYRIRKIVNDRYGNIWIGSRFGIFFQKAGTDSIVMVRQIDPLPSRTRSYSIYDIFIDRNEVMWTGTFSFGVGYTDFRRKPFHLYNISDEENTFSAKMINCFAACDKDNIWIGTEESGLFLFNRNTLKFKQFRPDPKNKNSLAGENVKAIEREEDGNLWIGYYSSGIDYFEVKSGKIIHFKTDKNHPNSIASNSIRSMLLDHEDNLWIGTDKGLDLFLRKAHELHHFNLNMEVLTLFEDKTHNIWAGTSGDGIYRLKSDSLSFVKVYPMYFSTSIKAIYIDTKENLWVGTNKGLYFVNSKTDSLIRYGINDGLPSNIILDILEDSHRNLWVSTGAGLIKCNDIINNPHSLIIKQFKTSDGLQGAQFRESAAYKNTDSEFYMGGDQGFNIFNPDSIKSNPYPPMLAFTQLKILNKEVGIGDKIKGRVVLDKAINQKNKISLSYQHSQISIEFAALHYSNPESNIYRFKLSPLEKDWNYSTGIRNFANYSNLQGGDYSFIVEGANSDGLWNPEPIILNIKVIPPFWKTVWFVSIIIILFSISIFAYYLNRISRLKRRNTELEQKVEDRTSKLKESYDNLLEKQSFIEEQSLVLKKQTDQLLELNSTKDKFFSIISHDLKSPFQSLLGISELLMEELDHNGNEKQKRYAQLIHDSSNNIFLLVENLLTWSRAQTNKISFEPQDIDLSSVIDNVLLLLQSDFEQKHISVEKNYPETRNVFADKNMVEMIVRNLISNAVKFTHERGKIAIILTADYNVLQVEVRDNGFGISHENQIKLFKLDSNYTRKGTLGEKGTGLGLILCKEFIEKNKGRIWVESKENEGSSFFFTLPLFNQKNKPEIS